MKTDFEIALRNFDSTLKKIDVILERMLRIAERNEDYELCEKIHQYQNMVIPHHLNDEKSEKDIN